MTKPDKCIMSLARWMETGRWGALSESCEALHEEAITECGQAIRAEEWANAATWQARADSILRIHKMLETARKDDWWLKENADGQVG